MVNQHPRRLNLCVVIILNKEEYRKKIENIVLMDSTAGKVQAISKLAEEILEELFTTSDLEKRCIARKQFGQLDDKLDEIDSAIDNLLKEVGDVQG